MKKEVLFVIPALDLGGAEKSFVNLLNAIDYTKYHVDVFLMTRTGMFLDLIPKEVCILPQSDTFSTFSTSFLNSILQFIKQGKPYLALQKVRFSVYNKVENNPVLKEQKSWKYLRYFFAKQPKTYDVAISYLEKTSGYYVAEKTVAKEKIAWIHTDLEQLGIDFEIENTYLQQFTYLVTVSDGLTERLKKKLPQFSAKIKTIENINSKKLIDFLASKTENKSFSKEAINIVYVGRLAQEKGLFNALDAIDILIEKKYPIHWYLIGTGNKKEELEKVAVQKGISGHIHFFGSQNNPYPFIKEADLFILTSFYEGKSISLEEAKILRKPIVITNFSSAKDQIVDGETGLIAEMTPESIAEKIETLLTNVNLVAKLVSNLEQTAFGNETEIEKFYDIIDG